VKNQLHIEGSTDVDNSMRERDAWLWVAGPPAHDAPSIGQLLRTYRGVHNISQQELADFLGFNQSYISRLETGQRILRDVGHLRHIAKRLDIPIEELASAAGMLREVAPEATVLTPDGDSPQAMQQVAASQRQWRLVRQGLNRRRFELTKVASSLYTEAETHGSTALLVRPEWLPKAPVDLENIQLAWAPAEPDVAVTGTEPEARPVFPIASVGTVYRRYSRALRDLDRPTLFENRLGYRLVDLDWQQGKGTLTFGLTTYFDHVDVCEAVAHELAAAWLRQGAGVGAIPIPWSELPLRQIIGDPFDLSRRALLPSINTLTIRRSGASGAFILHHRDASRVAMAGGVFHVMPAGVFQPSSLSPIDQTHDFDLWHNMLREFSEEFLGNAEHDGSASSPIDYEGCEPFRSMNRAREEGKIRSFCFGIGLDPLTLAGEILVVTVIDDDVFDEVFRDFIAVNSEGVAVAAGDSKRAAQGIPFNEANVSRLLERERVAPAAAACLDLAWQHRILLLT
jgi:transcriptional regulator with XRE-family HTH domain